MAFSYYKSLTLDHTQCGATDATDWPLLIGPGYVQGADADLKTVGNGGFVQSSSGYDIRPYADSALTTPLAFELVYYDGATGSLELHVKIPTLSHTVDTVIYLAFGDAGVSTDGSSTGAWESHFQGVWHLKDGSTLALTDSTSGGYHLTNTGSVTASAGHIAGGVTFGGSNSLDNTSLPGVSAHVTLSAWVNLLDTTRNGAVMHLGSLSGGGYDFGVGESTIQFSPGNKLVAFLPGVANIGFDIFIGTGWHYLAMTRDATTWRGYVDGVVGPVTDTSTPGAPLLGVSLGNDNGNGLDLPGDEYRVSSVDRSVDWLLADYNAQKSSSTFITWGSKTLASGGGGGGGTTLPVFLNQYRQRRT